MTHLYSLNNRAIGFRFLGSVLLPVFFVAGIVLIAPFASGAVAPPSAVFGKEYSDTLDKDFLGGLDPQQNLAWDGFGGVADAFDYSPSMPFLLGDHQVDAIANSRDLFFSAVTSDAAPLLVSVAGVDNIHVQEEGPAGGATAVWATAADINAAPGLPHDVDGLEVWGPIDSNHFSIALDPAPGPGSPGISVWYYDGVTSVPYILKPDLAAAIGASATVELIDLDALMVSDRDNNGVWDDGDSIMFSVRDNITAGGTFDGGEIWVWTAGAGPATFLDHGGVTWDTANDVAALLGVSTQEVDALEAIPEPGSLALVGIGALAMLRCRRNR